MYYFVEKESNYIDSLKLSIKTDYPNKKNNVFVVQNDCNAKLFDMAKFLRKNSNYRVLAFVDPYGMSVNWDSIETLKGFL